MKLLNKMKEYENKLYSQGYELVAGFDEVGRGCIAGPLVAAMVIFDKNYTNEEIKDSKKLSKLKREQLYNEIYKNGLCCGN